jgi:hypothetical protein
MMKYILFLVFILSFVLTGYTSDKSSGLSDVKLGFQKYPWMGDIPYFGREQLNYTPVGYFEANYRVFNNIDIGANFGFSLYKNADFCELEQAMKGEGAYPVLTPLSLKPLLNYGINLNIFLLPMIFQSDLRIIDLYVSSKIGGIYFSGRNKEVVFFERSLFDYGIYGGVAVFPFKHWGFYYEYGYGNYIRWKVGLNLKLNKQ